MGFCFLANLAARAIWKIEGFSYRNGKNKFKNSVHCSIPTKKLINIKVRKTSILALNNTFLGQNKLKMELSNLSVPQKESLMQDRVSRLRCYVIHYAG